MNAHHGPLRRLTIWCLGDTPNLTTHSEIAWLLDQLMGLPAVFTHAYAML